MLRPSLPSRKRFSSLLLREPQRPLRLCVVFFFFCRYIFTSLLHYFALLLCYRAPTSTRCPASAIKNSASLSYGLNPIILTGSATKFESAFKS